MAFHAAQCWAGLQGCDLDEQRLNGSCKGVEAAMNK